MRLALESTLFYVSNGTSHTEDDRITVCLGPADRMQLRLSKIIQLSVVKYSVIPYVSEVIKERIDKYFNKLVSHPNPLVTTLTQPMRNGRLKRRWTSDLHD